MGYCYTRSGSLCCDICGSSGGVRKSRCPHGYCQPIACCQSSQCKDKLKKRRKDVCSTSCKEGSDRMAAWQSDLDEKLNRGLFLRSAAVGESGFRDCVRVWFSNKANKTLIRYMARQTYHSYPIGCVIEGNVTIEDYALHGEVTETPMEFCKEPAQC